MRIAWMDHARGLAIILVVYGHCFRGLQSAGYLPAGGALAAADYVIYGFHMPLFFFLAGVVSAKAFTMSPWPFLRSRAVALVWPYLLWMSLELALLKSFSGMTNIGQISVGIGTYIFNPISPFWFLYALFVANLFVYLFRHSPRSALLPVAFCLFAAGRFVPFAIVPLTAWGMLYFALGLRCSGWVRRPSFSRALASPLVLVLATFMTVGLGLAFLRLDVDYALALPVAVTGSAMVFGAAVWLARWAPHARPLALVSLLGQISLTVLVVHVLGTAGVRIVLSKAFHLQTVWLHLLLGTAGGLALPLGLQWVCARLSLLKLLGLPVVRAAPAVRDGGTAVTPATALPPQGA